jgi:translation initiation factor IF-3
MSYREGGKKVLEFVLDQTKEKAALEIPPKMEGRQMMMILTPAKGK